MSKDVARVYVELDMLLDTRLGVLHQMGLDIAEKALFSGWHEREEDNFPGVDMAEYRRRYAARDVETLKVSIATEANIMLKGIMDQLREQCATRPFYKSCKMIVNVFPYVLDDEELDAFESMIQFRMGNHDDVQMVRIDPKDLTPTYCKQFYGMMVMYNAESWINYQMPNLEKRSMPEIMLLTPAMYHVKKPTQEEMDACLGEAMHPLQAYELTMSFYVELKLIDVAQACIVKPGHTAPDESPQEETPETEVPVGTREKVTMHITDLDDPSRSMEEATIEKTADGWKHIETRAI